VTARKVLVALWWGMTIAIIAWGWYAYRINEPTMHHHVDEAVLYVLLVPTFPAGIVAVAALAITFMALDAIAGVVVPGGPVMMTVTSLIISVAGFFQWFYGLPGVRRWWGHQHERPHIR
jgi:hypothetical protein